MKISLRTRQANGGARWSEAARDQGIEDGAIGLPHDARRAHNAARVLRHDRLGFAKMRLRHSDDGVAGFRYRRTRQHDGRVGSGDAGRLQRLARQVEAPERGVFVEIAQNVGELERAPQMMGERTARVRRHSEHAHRKASHRASDPVAIEVERGAVRCADVGDHVHLHAVDDGDEILALEVEFAHRLRQGGERRRCGAAIDRVDIAAPLLQLRAPRVARTQVVGDIVDSAAERIDFEHGLALRPRQDAHRGVERTARGALGRRCGLGLVHSRTSRLLRRSEQTPAGTPRRAAENAGDGQRGDGGRSQMHAVAERVARLEQAGQAMGERVDDGDFEREAPIVDLGGKDVALRQQPLCAFGKAVQAGEKRRRRPRFAQRLDGGPAGGECIERNVDPVEIEIIRPAVLQVIDDLQCGAQGIIGGPSGTALAVYIEHETADRHCRKRTIADEVVPVAVAQLGRVELECRKQILRVLRRKAALGQRRAQPHRCHVLAVGAGEAAVEARRAG